MRAQDRIDTRGGARRRGRHIELGLVELGRITQAGVSAALDLKLKQYIAGCAGGEGERGGDDEVPAEHLLCAEVVVLVNLALGVDRVCHGEARGSALHRHARLVGVVALRQAPVHGNAAAVAAQDVLKYLFWRKKFILRGSGDKACARPYKEHEEQSHCHPQTPGRLTFHGSSPWPAPEHTALSGGRHDAKYPRRA